MTVTDRHERTCGARDHLIRDVAQDNAMKEPDADRMRMFYAEHAAAISRYALRLTGDRALAEDVVQETLLRAWQHPEVSTTCEVATRLALHCCPQYDHRRAAEREVPQRVRDPRTSKEPTTAPAR